MTNAENLTPIDWLEVREGDVLLHENGDRLTVKGVAAHNIRTVTGYRSVIIWGDYGFTPYRRKPEMPTEPGAYHDKDGTILVLADGLRPFPWCEVQPLGVERFRDEEMADRAPFTRLVPMPTEEQIRETLFKTDPGTIYGVDAVVDGMKSLLGGGDNA